MFASQYWLNSFSFFLVNQFFVFMCLTQCHTYFFVDQHLPWPYVLHDTTTNHTSDCIVLFINFSDNNRVGLVK